jgi:hypothetical protein
LVETHHEEIDNSQVVDFLYTLDDLATEILDLNMMSVHENPHHDWLLDSRASIYVIGNHKALGTIKKIGSKIIIKTVDGQTHPTIGKGHVLLDFDELVKNFVISVPEVFLKKHLCDALLIEICGFFLTKKGVCVK